MRDDRKSLPQFRITRLRNSAGYWQARVTVDGQGRDVDRKFGSWQMLVRTAPGVYKRTFIPTALAVALQAKVRPLERKAAKAVAA